VDKINPEKDVQKLKSVIPRSLASAIPDPILYEHGQVGPCNDLIFGFSLVDYATSKGLQEGEIPKIVRICIEEIDKRGLQLEGIYRVCHGSNFSVQLLTPFKVSGRQAIVHQLQHDVERDEADFHFLPRDDVYAVASLLKVRPPSTLLWILLTIVQLYLRELPEPVFRFSLQDRMHHTEDRGAYVSG